MNLAKKLWMTTGDSSGGGPTPSGGYVDDVFSTYVYKGNGVNRSFVTGQNLLAAGGMVWTKGRSGTYGATDHYLFHTERGSDIFLSTNTANGQGAFTAGTSVSSFNNDGFSLGTSPYVNNSATEYVSWVFKNAPKFYGHQVVTKSAGSNASVSFPELGELGMVRVKSISGAGNWYVWHRSLPAGYLLFGEATSAAFLSNYITVFGTTVTLTDNVLSNGQYLVEAFAHDTALDGIVQCGYFTTDVGGDATVTLGWEPQFLIDKASSTVTHWVMRDSMRGFNVTTSSALQANLSNAENAPSYNVSPTSTGFKFTSASGIQTYIYLAIRRPNKPPTSGTQVYNAIARNGTSSPTSITGVGFAPDLVRVGNRTFGGATYDQPVVDRLRGDGRFMRFDSIYAEAPGIDVILRQDGINISSTGNTGLTGTSYIDHYFKRAPGFMDIVCDTGTGAAHTISHSLGSVPQMMIRKARSAATQWEVWHSLFVSGSNHLVLNSSAGAAADATVWTNGMTPTATTFTVGGGANANASNQQFVTYLFATLPGISKVGSYLGNGSSQTIPCGFTTGSRFILVKRIDSPGDWCVWDSVRGITPSNDPHLSLNTTAAEVPNDNSVGQHSSGFTVNQDPATNINVSNGSYIFLAIA